MSQCGRSKSGNLFWGVTMIALGTLFLLDRLDIVDVHYFFRDFWPMFIVLVGVSHLLSRRSLWGGLWIVTIGLWLEAVTLGLFGLTFENSWPLLLIFVGAGMVLRSFIDVSRRRTVEQDRGRTIGDRHEP
ncbi:MAG: DUF5668 domain-containing protein [Acidobacteriota bacterium]